RPFRAADAAHQERWAGIQEAHRETKRRYVPAKPRRVWRASLRRPMTPSTPSDAARGTDVYSTGRRPAILPQSTQPSRCQAVLAATAAVKVTAIASPA